MTSSTTWFDLLVSLTCWFYRLLSSTDLLVLLTGSNGFTSGTSLHQLQSSKFSRLWRNQCKLHKKYCESQSARRLCWIFTFLKHLPSARSSKDGALARNHFSGSPISTLLHLMINCWIVRYPFKKNF